MLRWTLLVGGWLLAGWLTLVVLMAIWGKPRSSDDRAMCALALLLWPVAIGITAGVGVVGAVVLGLNAAVRAAANPADAVARFAAHATRYPVRARLTARVRSAETRNAAEELRAARQELDAFVAGEDRR